MEQQILQAVEIALSGTADASLKNQAIQFVNEIKATEEGYKTCLDLLVASPAGTKLNDGLRFFIFQVLDENIDKLTQEQLYTLNTSMFKYLNDIIALDGDDAVYLRNKLADVFGHLFCLVYPSVDADFLKTLLLLASSNNILSVDYYLRIMISIHSEIGDKLISRTRETQDRNNALKDLIRERDMPQLVHSWKTVLQSVRDETAQGNALKLVGYYVDWMDFTLFIQNGFLPLIYDFLSVFELRRQACSTLVEIISKKMKPASKLELISILDLASISQNSWGRLTIVLENDASLLPEINALLHKLWPIVDLPGRLRRCSLPISPSSSDSFSPKVPALATDDLLSTILRKVIDKMK
ncbi:pre-tRNA nuclear export protein [Clavispora lusitaniae]|nr:pre-tRNA nuclear export protein [Clavispora lusitaniae]